MTDLAAAPVREVTIPVTRATADSLEGYGWILGRGSNAPAVGTGFFGNAVELRKPTQFQSDETTILSLATVQRRPFEVQWVERHMQHTQSFIPLAGKPFVLVMARPTEAELPEVDDLEAFLFDGTDGFVMDIGTWHEFPFAIVDDTDVVVILREATNQSLQVVENNEAIGDDLEKRDIAGRAGARIRIEF